MIEFISWGVAVALTAAFLLSLAVKWRIIEWLQVHAPSDFFYRMFSCKFCCSWWMSLILAVIACFIGGWWLVFLPVITTPVVKSLW